MRFCLQYILCFVLIVGNNLSIKAQPGLYRQIAHYTNANGLPQNSIQDIAEDRYHYIWMTTNMGLVRFDGRHMQVFNTISTPAIPYNRLSWIFPYKNNLLVVNPEHLSSALEISDINVIKEIKRSDESTALSEADSVMNSKDIDLNLLRKHVSTLLGEPVKFENIVYFLSKKEGYFRYRDKLWYVNNLDITDCGMPLTTKKTFLHQGNVLYGINPKGKLVGWQSGKPVKELKGSLPELILQSNPQIVAQSVFIQTNQQLFFKCHNSLYIVLVKHGFLQARLLSKEVNISDIFTIFYQEKNGSLLICTLTTGLYVYRKQLLTPLIFKNVSGASSINSVNSIYAIQPLSDTMFLTTRGIITLHTSVIHKNNEWNRWHLIKLSNNRFIAESAGLLYIVDEHFNIIKPLKQLPHGELSTYVAQNNIFYIAVDSTITKVIYKGGDSLKATEPTTLHIGRIHSMMWLSNNTMLLAAQKGVFTFDLISKKLSVFSYKLQGKNISTLYKDHSGCIWMGSYDRGWFRYSNDVVMQMPLDKNHYLISTHTFLEDKQGYLWVSTNNGLFRFSLAELYKVAEDDKMVYFNYYDKNDGSLSNEYNGSSTPGAIVTANGHFVFPSIMGMVYFHPDSIPVGENRASLIIESIKANNTHILQDSFVLPPNFNLLQLHVSTPYFGNPYNLFIQYRLSGGNSQWIPLNEDGIITFNRLAPGSYTLQLRQQSTYGYKKYIEKTVRFSVQPHWYESVWFYVLLTVVLASLFPIYSIYQLRSVKRQKKMLEQQVEERTYELEIALNSLEQTVDELNTSEARLIQSMNNKSRITSMVLHDIKAPLMYLDHISGNMYENASTNDKEFVQEQLYQFHLTVKEMGAQARNLLAWINVKDKAFDSQPLVISLSDLLAELLPSYVLIAGQRHNQILNNVEKGILIQTHPELLKVIYRNLLDNAIKYTSNGVITLFLKGSGSNFTIIVKDTGRGIPPEKVAQLMTNSSTQLAEQEFNLGYRFIQDMLKRMNGSLHIDSTLGQGTTVTITFKQLSALNITEPGPAT